MISSSDLNLGEILILPDSHDRFVWTMGRDRSGVLFVTLFEDLGLLNLGKIQNFLDVSKNPLIIFPLQIFPL